RAQVAARLDAEGLVHDGVWIAFDGRCERLDLRLARGAVTVYGQSEITRHLVAAREAAGAARLFEAAEAGVDGVDGDAPVLRYRWRGERHELRCDFVAGCDGYHGVSRRSIPSGTLQVYERVYPFGWLGILADTRPVLHELVYSSDEHGFALCSM